MFREVRITTNALLVTVAKTTVVGRVQDVHETITVVRGLSLEIVFPIAIREHTT